MSSTLENVSAAAVWGSLVGTAILGAHLVVQGIYDEKRRARFYLFAIICGAIVLLDFCFPLLSHDSYELLRSGGWMAYSMALLWLFDYPIKRIFTIGASSVSAATLIYLAKPDLLSSWAIPSAFAVAALVHGAEFKQRREYASCVLMVYALVLFFMCCLYYPVVSTGDTRIIALGYIHFAYTITMSVLFGWVHLPRALRGGSPVKISFRSAAWFATALIASEIGVQVTLLLFSEWPPAAYLVFNACQGLATLLLYFVHRHQLVIYTDNVAELLEERTASLQAAQRELSRQNEIQAIKVVEQAREIQAKAEVIERQRRVELAAQTAGQAAHDMQNLLSPILIHLDELDELRSDPTKVHSISRTIKTQVNHLLLLNNQLLALARRGKLERTLVTTEEVAKCVNAQFPNASLLIQVEERAFLLGSLPQLLRAVTNLVANALEASCTGSDSSVVFRTGRIELSHTKRCHLGFLAPGSYVYFEVTDSGAGIRREQVDKIFEPFFSSKAENHRSGSGLGLSIVAAVTEDHRGVVDLSTGSSGTKFSIYIPEARPVAGSSAPRAQYQNVTALVVDRDTANQRRCEEILSGAGVNVILASSGRQALRVVQAEHIDLIIVGLELPDLSGDDTIFGALHIRPGIRPIVLTGPKRVPDGTRLRLLGVTDLLTPPIEEATLLDALRSSFGDTDSPSSLLTAY